MLQKPRRGVLWTPLWPLNPFDCGQWFYFLKLTVTCSFDSCRVAGTLLYEVFSWFAEQPGTKRRMNSIVWTKLVWTKVPAGMLSHDHPCTCAKGWAGEGMELSWGWGQVLQGTLMLIYYGGWGSPLCGCKPYTGLDWRVVSINFHWSCNTNVHLIFTIIMYWYLSHILSSYTVYIGFKLKQV